MASRYTLWRCWFFRTFLSFHGLLKVDLYMFSPLDFGIIWLNYAIFTNFHEVLQYFRFEIWSDSIFILLCSDVARFEANSWFWDVNLLSNLCLDYWFGNDIFELVQVVLKQVIGWILVNPSGIHLLFSHGLIQ